MNKKNNKPDPIISIMLFMASGVHFSALIRTGDFLSFLACVIVLALGIVNLRRWMDSKK